MVIGCTCVCVCMSAMVVIVVVVVCVLVVCGCHADGESFGVDVKCHVDAFIISISAKLEHGDVTLFLFFGGCRGGVFFGGC